MTDKRQLFGTDGIRGVAGEYPLDRPTVRAVGEALAHRIKQHDMEPRVLIGQDTRESSEWITEALAQGLAAEGITVISAGVITTPGVAFLARRESFGAGVVISASHNPWRDNGIKVFGHDGYKLSDAIEHEIEGEIFSRLEKGERIAEGGGPPPLAHDGNLREHYVEWLAQNVAGTILSRFHVLVDCANGAASSVAPAVFKAVGVQAEFTNVKPDGRNINADCGALHPEYVAKQMAANSGKYDVGITFDGDADRALFSDKNGNVVNGDAVLLLTGRDMKARGHLPGDTVVATTMSNMGLEAAFKRAGIRMMRAAVGDKYVLEQMRKIGATLGGEQSGHIIFRDGDSTTGDGLLTALRVLEVMARTGRSLADLVGDLVVFPQTIRNVRVREKLPFNSVPEISSAISAAEKDLGDNGRVVVRYSGTERLARVMIEAASEEAMNRHVDAIAGAIQRALGE